MFKISRSIDGSVATALLLGCWCYITSQGPVRAGK